MEPIGSNQHVLDATSRVQLTLHQSHRNLTLPEEREDRVDPRNRMPTIQYSYKYNIIYLLSLYEQQLELYKSISI
jgi:hypothetical protein